MKRLPQGFLALFIFPLLLFSITVNIGAIFIFLHSRKSIVIQNIAFCVTEWRGINWGGKCLQCYHGEQDIGP